MRITVDGSSLKKTIRELERLRFELPNAIASGLNEGGTKVRTQVQKALQAQTGLKKYSSVTSRVRTVRAFPAQGNATTVSSGSGIGQGMQFQIIVQAKPSTKIEEFRYSVSRGKGGAVVAWLWGVPHRFKRSFEGAGKIDGKKLMRVEGARLPLRSFKGPNLAKEAVIGETREAFFAGAETLVLPRIVAKIRYLLK